MKRMLFSIAALLAVTTAAFAQPQHSYDYELGGAVFSNDALRTSDFFTLSQQQFNFGTARSMAMGGAFTSLGADQAAMALNPAGLGMYRRNEVAITPMVIVSSAETAGAGDYLSNSKTRFGLGNIGGVFNIYETSERRLMSVNLGIGYTRLADFNYNYSFGYAPAIGRASIADAMSVMLEAGKATLSQNGTIMMDDRSNWGIDPFFWPAVAGYKSYLVDRNAYGVWYPAGIGANALIEGGTALRSRGSIGELDFSVGANYDNKLYFGLSIGVQTVYRKQSLYYGEAYSYGPEGGNGYDSPTHAVDADGMELPEVMQGMGLQQNSTLDGAGINFKLGLIYRPVAGLRLGVALHTPTFYSLDRRYDLSMATRALGQTSETDLTTHEYTSDIYSEILEDEGPNSWDFVSPTRLMFGVSYTFGNVAILSVDYERTWYNGIRVKNQPYLPYGPGEQDFKQDFKTYFKGSNSLRAGLEVRPLPAFALRIGYGYTGSMLKEKNTILSSPAICETSYYTAGVGFNLGRSCFLDLAYCYTQNKMTEYMLFYGNRYDNDDASLDVIYESDRYSTELKRHQVALTFGYRF